MVKQVHISQLSSSSLTRIRGQEAYERLLPIVQKEQVEIDLTGVAALSMSFLDGLVSQLLTSGHSERTTFVADEKPVLDKLSRIADIRHAVLYFRSTNSPRRLIVPHLASVHHDVTVAQTKPPSGDDEPG